MPKTRSILNPHLLLYSVCLALGIFFMTVMFQCFAATNSYYIDQSRMEVTIDPKTGTASGAVKLTSNSANRVKIQVVPKLWNLDPEGNITYINSPDSDYDLAGNLLINPREFELPAGRSQLVRFMLRAPARQQDAEYPFQLLFQPVASLNQDSSAATSSPVIQQSLDIIPVFTTTVYAYQGHPKPDVVIDKLTCMLTPQKTLSIVLELSNKGTKHARLFGNLIVNQKAPSGEVFQPVGLGKLRGGNLIFVFPKGPRVLAEEPNVFSEQFKTFLPGDYRLELQLADERKIQPAMQTTCDIHVADQ